MNGKTLSAALAGVAALAFAPTAGAQDWNRDMGQAYGEQAYGYDLRGPYYAPGQQRNTYGQRLQPDSQGGSAGGRQAMSQGQSAGSPWNQPTFGDASRQPYNYYGPIFEQQPQSQYYAGRQVPGVGGQQQSGREHGQAGQQQAFGWQQSGQQQGQQFGRSGQQQASGGQQAGQEFGQSGQQFGQQGQQQTAGQQGGATLPAPDVVFYNPVTDRTTAFWIDNSGSQQQADRQYQSWRDGNVEQMDRDYGAWRSQQSAQMDRDYEAWKRQQLSAMDQRYQQDRNQAMAEADRAYQDGASIAEARRARQQYLQSLND